MLSGLQLDPPVQDQEANHNMTELVAIDAEGQISILKEPRGIKVSLPDSVLCRLNSTSSDHTLSVSLMLTSAPTFPTYPASSQQREWILELQMADWHPVAWKL